MSRPQTALQRLREFDVETARVQLSGGTLTKDWGKQRAALVAECVAEPPARTPRERLRDIDRARAKLECDFVAPGSTMYIEVYNQEHKRLSREARRAREEMAEEAEESKVQEAPPAQPSPPAQLLADVLAEELKLTPLERAKALASFEAAEASLDVDRMREIANSDAFKEAEMDAAIEEARECRLEVERLPVLVTILAARAERAATQYRISKARAKSAEGRLAAIEARLNRLDTAERTARGGFTYEGVWDEGRRYSKGMFVTRDGSLWHANAETSARPGEDNRDWTLAVKRGRDGKDAR